ncbi:MAG: PrsW family intramembrane metalloprotease [Rhodospirillales bacterium]|nr:PrsW family intramembrane metalloprotease [Rhodospirillales bacterium]
MLRQVGFAVAMILPVVGIVALHASRHCPMPRARLRWTVSLCVVTAFVAALASAAVVMGMPRGGGEGVVATAGTTWRVLPLLALFEEISRFVVLAGYSLRARHAAGPRDGIVLGLAAGLTFALLENIMSAGGPAAGSAASGWLRIALATPLHALLGGLMGYLIVRARSYPTGRFLRLAEALLLPAAIHVVYDTPVLLALAYWGEAMTVEVAGLAVTLSAGVDLALAWYVWRLFSAAPAAASAAQRPASRTPPAT